MCLGIEARHRDYVAVLGTSVIQPLRPLHRCRRHIAEFALFVGVEVWAYRRDTRAELDGAVIGLCAGDVEVIMDVGLGCLGGGSSFQLLIWVQVGALLEEGDVVLIEVDVFSARLWVEDCVEVVPEG